MKIHLKRAAIAGVVALALTSIGTAGLASPVKTQTDPVPAGITVPKVTGMTEDFIHGADFSSVLSLEESGVKFKNFDGEEADLFEVLADSGINYARIRVWNDPFLSTDPTKGYGGGNVDANRATSIGKRATAAGMKVLVNFHYSDFWAHPGQQYSPKAWRGLSNEDRAQAIYDYTAQTLGQMADAGVDIGMVQIGNETTNGEIAGVRGWANTAPLYQAGSKAVRDTLGNDVKVAVHFTNPERVGQYANAAKELDQRGVDYDVFLSSYYAYWHGSLSNLTSVLDQVASTYDKEVAVVETSWGYTLEDGDGTKNSVTSDYPAYSTSVQGQALAMRDVMQAVADVKDAKGLGTFYWEPAWLPVGPPETYDANWDLWQRDGSGWATSYSQEFYDPEGLLEGKWADDFGGSGWDNQALFGHDGTPHESLKVYQYAKTGSIAERQVDVIGSPRLTILEGDGIALPTTVSVSYTDGTSETQDVVWHQSTDWISGTGTYVFTGTTGSGLDVTADVTVLPISTDSTNYVVNPGFEQGTDAWTGSGSGYTLGKSEDPFEGDRSTHFYSATAGAFSIQQEITNVPPGSYRLSAKVQGENKGASRITVSSGISSISADFELAGYLDWQTPQTDVINVAADGVVTVSASFELSAGAWGTIDAFALVAEQVIDEADATALRTLLDSAAKIDQGKYTEESVAVLARSLARAKFVLDAPAANQSSIDSALAELEQAIGLLELIEEETDPENPGTNPGTDPGDSGTNTEQPGGGQEKPEKELPTTDANDVDVPGNDLAEMPETGTNLLGTVAVLAFLLVLGSAVVMLRARRRATDS